MRGLRDKVAIVTGAASPIGIGFAAAKRLAEEGAQVVLTDINHAGVAERAGELRRDGHRVIGLAHDAVDEGAWEEVLRVTKAEFGVLDILVNNAAICVLSHVVDMQLADWRRQLDVHVPLCAQWIGHLIQDFRRFYPKDLNNLFHGRADGPPAFPSRAR